MSIIADLRESLDVLLKLRETLLRNPKKSYGPGTKNLAACLAMAQFVEEHIPTDDLEPFLIRNREALMQTLPVGRDQIVQHGYGFGVTMPADMMLLRYPAETSGDDRLLLAALDIEYDLWCCVMATRHSELGPKKWLFLPPPFWLSLGVPFSQRLDREKLGVILAGDPQHFDAYTLNVFCRDDVYNVDAQYDMLTIIPAFLYAMSSHGAGKVLVNYDGDSYFSVSLNGIVF